MKNKFFSKEFWSKKRIIGASAAGGIAIVAVAVAVPVALTAQSRNSDSDSTSTDEQVQVITRDETQNEDYTQDIPYGTPLNELVKFAPVLDGYGEATLNEQETNYAPTKNVGSQDISASYLFKPLLGSTPDKSTLKVKLKIEIQKAYLQNLENFEGSVAETQIITGPMSDWTLYDVSMEQVPDGSVIDQGSVEYYIADSNYKVTLEDLEEFFVDATDVNAVYLVKPDQNHYGKPGSFKVRYQYSARAYEVPEEKVFSLIGVKGTGDSVTLPVLKTYAGFRNKGFSLATITDGKVKFYLASFIRNNGNYHRLMSAITFWQPYVNFVDSLFEEPEISYKLSKWFGTKMTFEPPPKIQGYGDWTGPDYKLTKVVASDANNYNPDYGDLSKPISAVDIPNIPANSKFSVTFNAKSQTKDPDLKYVIEVSVDSVVFKDSFFYDERINSSDFGTPATVTVNRKVTNFFGRNATWDTSNPKWVIGKEGKGEVGNFKKGFEITDQHQNAMLPSGTVINAVIPSTNKNDNIFSGNEYVIVTSKVAEPQSGQILTVKYGDDLDAVKTLAMAAFGTPQDRKAPVLFTDFSTYTKGLVPGQISYVVYKYDSKTAGEDPLYKTYQVEVQKQTMPNFVQTSTVSFPVQAGTVPAKPTGDEVMLQEGWTLSSTEPAYYLENATRTEDNKKTAEYIKGLVNQQTYVAEYEVVTDINRYEPKSGKFSITYKVVGPAPAEMIYLPQKQAYADQNNKVWTEKSPPAAPAGWSYLNASYTGYRGSDLSITAFGSDQDKNRLKSTIEADTVSNYLEIIWVYKNSNGKYLWIVEPFGLSAELESYYTSNNENKAGPVNGTKIKFFDGVTSVALKGATETPITKSADNSYLIDKPAGSVLKIKYQPSGSNTEFSGDINVKKITIEGTNVKGRFRLINAGETFAPTPGRSLPNNFGQTATNKAEYLLSSLTITEQMNEKPGIYTPGLRISGAANVLELVKKLPTGTKFTINWTAGPLNQNYETTKQQVVVDTYVVVNS